MKASCFALRRRLPTPLVFSLTLLCVAAAIGQTASAESAPEYSTAGFHAVEGSPRRVFNFNVGWRFLKADAEGAEQVGFDDSAWGLVSCPHGLEYLPVEASGSINYQGPAWYRKRFPAPDVADGQRVFLHFEAVMGKSKVWVNGQLVAEHFGGYLPIVIDVTEALRADGGENLVAVRADNSDDGSYPPGKSQQQLDFTYFGGIYRDVWMYTASPLRVSSPMRADKVAGGGLFVHYENLTDDQIEVVVDADVVNDSSADREAELRLELIDPDGKRIQQGTAKLSVPAGTSQSVTQRLQVADPQLWSPDAPHLHRLVARVVSKGETTDAMAIKIGLRTVELDATRGLILNGKPFGRPLIGGNRHQDFAYLGNAMPNSLQWRDALKMRNAEMLIVRAAHYPMDPAFMDACDELGLFVIVATPGWQFWNWDATFSDRVVSDIRHMVRRDRNRASVIMWEPILNETRYPAEFGKRAHETVHEEYPFAGCHTACDRPHKTSSGERPGGVRNFDVLYGGAPEHGKPSFIREWGDNVDDWSAHNSTSRVARSWGEHAQIIQARHYADPRPEYSWLCIDRFYGFEPRQFGGCLWHTFDHNRGYHPDPFYGGITDAFRQPKYSYYVFQSQRAPTRELPGLENGPMLYIANEMNPFSSGKDVWVYTNCEDVRLSVLGKPFKTIAVKDIKSNMPHPPLRFTDVYHFMDLKSLSRRRKQEQSKIVAEGLIGGEVVVTTTLRPARRVHRLELAVDNSGVAPVADGSDVVAVIARLVDKAGVTKHLANERVVFEVEGPAELVDSPGIGANPRLLEWGTAPCLLRMTGEPGTVRVSARVLYEGPNRPLPGSVEFTSQPYQLAQLQSEVPSKEQAQGEASQSRDQQLQELRNQLLATQAELNELKLKKVEQQQTDFEQK